MMRVIWWAHTADIIWCINSQNRCKDRQVVSHPYEVMEPKRENKHWRISSRWVKRPQDDNHHLLIYCLLKKLHSHYRWSNENFIKNWIWLCSMEIYSHIVGAWQRFIHRNKSCLRHQQREAKQTHKPAKNDSQPFSKKKLFPYIETRLRIDWEWFMNLVTRCHVSKAKFKSLHVTHSSKNTKFHVKWICATKTIVQN